MKLAPVTPADVVPWAVTAARAKVLLPPGTDDRFADACTLMKALDAGRSADKPVLLTYVTITSPAARLHEQYEFARAFAACALASGGSARGACSAANR